MFDYDWFYGPPFEQQKQDARVRCVRKKFPDVDLSTVTEDSEVHHFCEELETRVLLYLRDGFSYELKDFCDLDSKTRLTFECEPIDERYKIGAFVVSVPFDDIVRVEVFAVHPTEKPEDTPMITGFRSGPDQAMSPNPHDNRPGPG